ncbi:MAG: gluP [Myxococcaceae bacterium]|nr:gluP [Myxococcaceae bacterium]
MRPSLTTPAPVNWSLGAALVAAHVARRLAHHAGPDALLRWGAIRSGDHRLADGWRLAAHGWLHVHAIHLALNLVPLLLLGPWIEQRVGRRRLAATWSLATAAGGLLAATTAPSGALIVGASGGSFGLLGFTLAQLWAAPSRSRDALAVFVAIHLLADLADPGAALSAHLGGALTGAIAGAVFRPRAAAATA